LCFDLGQRENTLTGPRRSKNQLTIEERNMEMMTSPHRGGLCFPEIVGTIDEPYDWNFI
jgi:hypothetical protein